VFRSTLKSIGQIIKSIFSKLWKSENFRFLQKRQVFRISESKVLFLISVGIEPKFVLSLFIFKVHRLLRARTLNPLTDPKARPAPVCPMWVTMIIGPLSTQPRPLSEQFWICSNYMSEWVTWKTCPPGLGRNSLTPSVSWVAFVAPRSPW